MAASDLAQLADVKLWLAGSSGIGANADPILTRLITDVSGAIYGYLGRPSLLPRTVTERYDGGGKQRLYLRQFPILSITQLLIDDVSIPAAPVPVAGAAWPQSGYLIEPWDGAPPGGNQAVDIYGIWSLGQPSNYLRVGRQNVVATYTTGYQVSGEVPGAASYVPLQPYGPWNSDQGVTYANGTALTPVTGVPNAGQYKFAITDNEDGAPPSWSVAYTFNAADIATGIQVAYGFVPASINNACIEWIAERYRYMTRVGQSSQSVNGQMTSAYSLKGVPDFIRASLDPYKTVVPA